MELYLFKFLLMKVESFFYLFAKRSDSQDSSDADRCALVVNARRGVVLRHFNFRKPVKDIQFSPNRLCVMLHIFFSASTDRHFLKIHFLVLTFRFRGHRTTFSANLRHLPYIGHIPDITMMY